MKTYLAPDKLGPLKHPVIFMAGSIEMGKAGKWQDKLASALEDYTGTLLNPRREHWNYHWHQSISDPHFREQLEWEFNGLSKSDYIAMYFAPDSKSPISLLELGLFSHKHKIICCCPKEFWRRGNVEFVCKKFNIPLVDSLDKLIPKIKKLCRTK